MKSKKLIFSFIMIMLTINIFGQQSFCPQGAVWHYDYSGMTSGGFIRIDYQKDTMLNGILCKKLQPVQYLFFIPGSNTHAIINPTPQFIYQRGDTVFYYFNHSIHNQLNQACASVCWPERSPNQMLLPGVLPKIAL